MSFKVLNHAVIRQGKVFSTIVDEIEYDSGNKSIREIAAKDQCRGLEAVAAGDPTGEAQFSRMAEQDPGKALRC